MVSEMAEKADRIAPTSPEGSPTIKGYSPLRKVFDKILGFVSSWRRNVTPRGGRISHRDVERDEFQYASTPCLSSYYSVFVVRLAIMVSALSFSPALCTVVLERKSVENYEIQST